MVARQVLDYQNRFLTCNAGCHAPSVRAIRCCACSPWRSPSCLA
ncbi:hypothetical protein ALSL_1502 [Aerosticca soli]|uniref:Uncharacterized protein n=1 Tax=Aerosticca soli TaxID=2010829 RepID=A0A2Z6E6N6_9GAMM|nr:hypothetical protein ALSL_1502 [Aerosticca soli]